MPVRLRSRASSAAMVCLALRLSERSSSSSASQPSRIVPPSERLTGGSSSMADEIDSRTSGSSSAFSRMIWSSDDAESDNARRRCGTCSRERRSAERSRGLAVPRLMRPTSRSRSATSRRSARRRSRFDLRSVQLFDRAVTRLDLAAPHGGAQEPGAQEARAHARDGRVEHVEERVAATLAALRGDQFEVAAGHGVEDEVVVRLEEGDVGDVRGGGALRLARVAQARARGADGLGLTLQAVAFERARAELFEQERRAGDGVPQPIVERGQRRAFAAAGGVARGRDVRDGRRVLSLGAGAGAARCARRAPRRNL